MNNGNGASDIDGKIGQVGLVHDHLFVGSAAGTPVGVIFGRPVVGVPADVSICHGLSKLGLCSSDNGSGSSPGPAEISAMTPLQVQSVVRTADHHALYSAGASVPDQSIESVDHNSDSEEPSDTGLCARTLPYKRPSRGDRRYIRPSRGDWPYKRPSRGDRPYIRPSRGDRRTSA